MADFLEAYTRKYRHSMHVERLIKSKSIVDDAQPHMFQKLPAALFTGIGPKKSLDQRISFVNENNNLARKIDEIHRRKDFQSGLNNMISLQLNAKKHFKTGSGFNR